MVKNFFSDLVLVTVLMFFVHCNNDPEPVGGSSFSNGVFIVNEGNFSDSDGSLSFYDIDSSKVSNKVFEAINDRPLAAVFQSMSFYGGYGFLIDQSGRIEIVDEETLLSFKVIDDDLVIPRYFAGYGNKGYVTDWGPYDESFMNNESRIKVFDLESLTYEGEFETSSRPEDILILKGKIYVANSGTNLISVYNPEDHSLLKEIEVNNGPTKFVVDKNDHIWVVSTGTFLSSGAIQEINTDNDEVLQTIDLGDTIPNGRFTIDGTGEVFFFMTEQWAPDYSMTWNTVIKGSVEDPDQFDPIITGQNLYGLGVDPVSGYIYVADAVAFQGNGKVTSYDIFGNAVEEITVGRGPRDFVFVRE
jgi:hypothetical protein